ncbi:non-ribosomal peptide synthetase component F [Catenulispora sp. GP43]|uniref:condensation domain-containing protein n=1 Tax=Catenulispora sp. GP43 TaxID=3156263 RepID=UPI003512DF3E
MNSTANGLAMAPTGGSHTAATLPLSSSQEQMWLLNQVAPTSQAYLMTWTHRLTGPLDAEVLRRAFDGLARRHEVLRTRYRHDGFQPQQIIDEPGPIEFRLIPLDEEPAEGRAQRALQIAAWERSRPFDLVEHWPIRVSLIGEAPDSHLLVINIHHIACDDVAFRIIAAELETLYAAELAAHPARLATPRRQYAEYALWEHERGASGALQRHLEYWRTALSGTQELVLPVRAAAGAPRTGDVVEFEIRPETSAAVHALATAHRASPFMVLLAAYHVWLSRLSGSEDVTVGFPVTHRTPDLDDLLGNLVNTAVSRTTHASGDSFVDILSQVRGRILDAMDHRFVPFARVVEDLNPTRGGGDNPLFRVAFDMERVDEAAGIRLAGLQADRIGTFVAPEAKFDLTLHVSEDAGRRLSAHLEYASSLIDEETARSWAVEAAALLETLVSDSSSPIPSVPASSPVPGSGVLPATADREATPDCEASASLIAVVLGSWKEVLENPAIGAYDNFFDVGGDSLRAVALAGRLRAAGYEVSAADIFAHQTVADLARLCADRQEKAAPAGALPRRALVAPFELLEPADRAALPADAVDAYPLAAMQLGMIIELRNRPGILAYQDSTSYLIRDEAGLDAQILQKAAQLVVDRHEILRTSFDLTGYSVPLQVVHRAAPITVELTEHGTLGADGWRPRLVEHAALERSTAIDMARPPLIRLHAHTAVNTRDWCITLTEFHPILEGWSFHTMLMEILGGYRALRTGETPVEPEPIAFRYADYVAAEAAARESDEHRDFWCSMIQGRDVVAVPVAWQDERARPRDRYQCLVDYKDLEGDLRRLAAETRTSLKAVLLAAHMKVMSMLAGTEEFYSGLVCDARPEVAGAERVLGMYLNTLPFAMPTGTHSWGGLVRAVYDRLTELWPHRAYPMQLIQQEHGHGGRLFEVFYNYLDFHQVDWDLVDEEATLNDNENEFALHVFSFIGFLKFNTTNHRLSRTAAARLAALYRTVLEEMALGPEGAADRPVLPSPERVALRALDRSGEMPDEPQPALAALAQRARLHPDKVAVHCGSETLTYAQLVDAIDKNSVAVPSNARNGAAVVEAIQALRHGDAQHSGLSRAVYRLHAALTSRGTATGVDSTWLCSSPLDSMRGLIELLTPLTAGGSVVVTAAGLPDSIPEIGTLLATEMLTHAQLSPLVAEQTLDTVCTSTVTVIDPVYVEDATGPVALDGVPLPGLRLQVQDDRGYALPLGVVGELSVDGTAPAGLPARLTLDGRLELAGSPRVHRTEELLAAEPAVRDARVIEAPDAAGDRARVLGFIRLETGAVLDPETVNRALAERRLPRSFVPDELIVVEEWPLTDTGSVDLTRLRETAERPRCGSALMPPWDERFEKALRDGLEALGERPLDPDRPLADLGLNSMATVSVIVALEEVYGLLIPDDFQIVDMLRTPRGLWEQIRELCAAQGIDVEA